MWNNSNINTIGNKKVNYYQLVIENKEWGLNEYPDMQSERKIY